MTQKLVAKEYTLNIWVERNSERQDYIFDLIFSKLIGVNYKIITEKTQGESIAYGKLESDFCFGTHGYLIENSIQLPVFETGVFQKKKFPFFNGDKKYLLPFDPFATCFYFLTRHEEFDRSYLDEHKRFQAENSWLWKNGWQMHPIVNFIAEWLRDFLETTFGWDLKSQRSFSSHPTIDIDNAYAFYGRKSTVFFSILRSALAMDYRNYRIKKLSAQYPESDPFNTHQKIIRKFSKKNQKPVVFVLFRNGRNNTKISLDKLKNIVLEYQKAGFEIAIHPSYNADKSKISEEINGLLSISNQSIKSSRHHFIKMNYSKEMADLEELGITHEFSMGYGNSSGFRAGICQSYPWFDLHKNKVSSMTVHPFYFMDATFIYGDFNLSQAMVEIEDIFEKVKMYRGEMSYIIHNELLSNFHLHEGWQKMLDYILEIE
jgi:hypothetical protein